MLALPPAAGIAAGLTNLSAFYKYMLFEFKTKPCLKIRCDDLHACRNYHSDNDRRRDPRELRNGTPANFPPWAYGTDIDECSPFERCYHPVNYKNQRCRDFWSVNMNVRCPRGQDCSFVHDEEEFLWKVYPEICYPIMTFEDFEYLVMNFKVNKCTNTGNHNRFECAFYHLDFDPNSENSSCDRRFPWKVDSMGEYIIDYAISSIELGMLPSKYKTSRCSPRNPNLPCRFKRCCFSHSDLETRQIEEYKNILKEKLRPPPFEFTFPALNEKLPDNLPTLSSPPSTNSLDNRSSFAEVIASSSGEDDDDILTEELLQSKPDRYIPLALEDSQNYEMYLDVETMIGSGMGASKVFGGFGHQIYPRRQKKEYFPVAIKIIPLGGNYLSSSHVDRLTTSELGFLLNLRSSNIISLYDHYKSITLPDDFIQRQTSDWHRLTNNNFSVFCMERFGISLAEMIQGTQSGGLHSQFHELYTKIDNHIYPRRTIYHMIKDLVKGLSAIHENFHVHRDLRPSNLLVCLDNPDGVRLKICDFGLARPLDKETDRTEFAMSSLAFNCHGTHPFQPPEVVRRRKDMDSKTVYSTRSDTYSAALCIYFLLTNGGHPVLYSGANYCTFSPKWYPSLRPSEEPVEMRNWYDDDEEFIISSIHEKFKSPKLTYGRDPETRAHGYYLEGIRHLPEAFDLVYQMVGKNGCVKDQRLSLAQCKEHCFFWDYSLRLEFLEIIHHIVNRAPPRQDLYDAMHVPEELAIYLPSSNVDQWDWSKIPSEKDQNWQNFLRRTQSAVVGNGGIEYDTRSLFHLLRLIRNVKCHLSDPRMGLKSCLGSLTSDSLARFLFDRFPGLISHLLQVPLLREIRDEALDKFWTKLRMSF